MQSHWSGYSLASVFLWQAFLSGLSGTHTLVLHWGLHFWQLLHFPEIGPREGNMIAHLALLTK